MTTSGKRGKTDAAGHIPRVYLDQPLTAGGEAGLAGGKAHHLRNVLRLGAGDTVIVFNGGGGEYRARITGMDRQRVGLDIEEHIACRRESSLDLILAQGIARGDRMDFAVAKAVELGVAAIQPLFTARGKVKLEGERRTRKTAHWQRVAVGAAEQSGRERVPDIYPPLPLADFLAGPQPRQGLVLDPRTVAGLKAMPETSSATLLVGPEAGLSDEEIQQARSAGYAAVGLGPRVLRTETAGIACLAALQTLWGDLG